jgi:BolA family transcriptional regulator, general stress-responsive regulator
MSASSGTAEHPVTHTLRERLTAALAPEVLELIDDSHLHAGHAGAQGGGRHYSVRIVSKKFAGLSPVAQHRLVYDAVRDLMPAPLHALALTTSAT